MRCHDAIVEWAEDFRDLVRTPNLRALAGEGGWFQGGCWTLAEAVRGWMGRKARLFSIHDLSLRKYQTKDLPASTLLHVVIRIGDCYIDADGAWTRDGLLREWSRSGRKLVLRPFDEKKDVRSMECPLHSVSALYQALMDEYGPADDLLYRAEL